MNARVVRKLLMRGRVKTVFGARALFIVRIPRSAIAEPVPPFKPPPGKEVLQGEWHHENEDGTSTYTTIRKLRSSKKPTPERRAQGDFVPTLHRVECLESEVDDEGDLYERWSWCEGVELARGPTDATTGKAPVLSRKNVPTEIVDAYAARRHWIEKYAWGPLGDHASLPSTGIAWLDALHDAGRCAKRFQPLVYTNSGAMDFSFFIQWRKYPEAKLSFCARMSRALKLAKRAGVHVRVLRPPRRR